MNGCEDIWISLIFPGTNHKTLIGLIYKHPKNNVKDFMVALNNKIVELNVNYSDLFIIGDKNINIHTANPFAIASKYLSMMTSNGFFPLITKPARITDNSATAIDHIFTTMLSKPV